MMSIGEFPVYSWLHRSSKQAERLSIYAIADCNSRCELVHNCYLIVRGASVESLWFFHGVGPWTSNRKGHL
jgi:hypothetical protein